jgi:hypothetical protein
MAQEATKISSLIANRRTHIGSGLGSTKSTTICSSTHNNEGILPSRPSYTIGTNIFGEIWSAHKSLGS